MNNDTNQDKENEEPNLERRNFLKGAALAATVAGGSASSLAQAQTDAAAPSTMPMKTLGSTGVKVPILHQGTAWDVDTNFDRTLHLCLREGITMFDTALQYGWGSSHRAMGNFIKQVGNRENLWITSKSHAGSPSRLQADLDECLSDIEIDYLDSYFMHGVNDARLLDPEFIQAGDQFRKSGKTKFFGFSCHDGNVVELMNKAAKVGGIDMILFRYNFRRYGDMELNKAMDACKKAGIGLMAMKAQASVPESLEKVADFKSANFTLGQAKLKSIWADERIDTIVSEMPTVQRARENIAAAKSSVDLAASEVHQLNRLAALTANYHCNGCKNLCENAIGNQVAIADQLRYLMYYESYDKPQRARELFSEIPVTLKGFNRDTLAQASRVCPQGIDIAARLEQAQHLLA